MSVKFIPLTKGQFAIVDADDFEWLSQWKWHFAPNGYVVRSIHKPRCNVSMHRQVMAAVEGQLVDHQNRDKTDCRRCNLRLATPSQSLQNRGRQSNNRSGYKGVSWCNTKARWWVRVHVRLKYKHVGYFKDLVAAAKAYDVAARKYYGEFAVLNFPEES